MPIIDIPFDLPFNYCRECKAFDPKVETWYTNNFAGELHRFCQNTGICTSAAKAKEYVEGPILCETCEYCRGVHDSFAVYANVDGNITGMRSCNRYKRRVTK